MIALPVPDAGPLFEGHFPGRPILPGIALLELALRAHAAGGRPVALRGIETLRFRRLVLPGEVLDLEVAPSGAPGCVALAVRRGGDRVAEAVVDLDAARREEVLSAAPCPEAQPGPRPEMPAPEGLLPHGPPAHLVVGIEACSAAGAVCAARVPEGHPLASSGAAPALMAIEMAAQAAGVFEALSRGAGGAGEEGGAPRLGYLVGARGVRFPRAAIPVETVCTASVRLVAAAGALSSYDFEVTCAGVALATGRVSTWLTARGA